MQLPYTTNCGFTVTGLVSVPRLNRVGYEQRGPEYFHDLRRRQGHEAVAQVSLGGMGASWEGPTAAPGPGWRPVPPGHVVLYLIGEEEMAFGTAPGAPMWEFIYVAFGGESAFPLMRELIRERGRVLPLDADTPAFVRLRRLIPDGGKEHRIIADVASARLVHEFVLAIAEQSGEHGRMQEARLAEAAVRILRRRLDRPLAVAAAARQLGVSRAHLSRVFARRVGEPPARWLRRQRLGLAESLLLDARLAVDDVARRCGFAGATPFIRAFRAEFGRTPGALRRGRGGEGG